MSGQFNYHYFNTNWHKRQAEKDAKFDKQYKEEPVKNENSDRINRNRIRHAKNNNCVGTKRRK